MKLKKIEEELKGMQQALEKWGTVLKWSAGTMVVGGIVALAVLSLGPVRLLLLILGVSKKCEMRLRMKID